MLQTECTWNDGFETADITPKWGGFWMSTQGAFTGKYCA